MNRKIGSLVLIFVLICSALVGCGSNDNTNNADSNNYASDNEDYATSDTADDRDGYEQEKQESEESGLNVETYAEIIENVFVMTADEDTSTFSIDVDTASYANVRDLLKERRQPSKDAVRIEEMINYFTYDYPEPEGDEPFSITTRTTVTPWNQETMVTMIGLQGKNINREQLPPSNIVMLIDVSGSMQDHNKLPLLKQSFDVLVKNLTTKDRVSLVVYAGAAGVVLEGAEGADYETIMDALEELESGGSTAGGQGIKLAYSIAEKYFIEGGNNRVVLASDGDFNVGMSSVPELEKLIEEQREKDIFLSVVGFGRGNIRDDVMEGLADKGNGNYSYIDTYQEAEKVFGEEFVGTMFTIAKDVKIQVEFNSDVVESYRLIGYENRVMSNEDFWDDTKDAGELGIGHEVTALYELVLKQDADVSEDKLYDVKLRYKELMDDQSKGIDVTSTGFNYLEDPSDEKDFQWALTVAEFGLLLRDSNFKADADVARMLTSANIVLQVDQDPYKEEFIGMVNDYIYMLEEGLIVHEDDDN